MTPGERFVVSVRLKSEFYDRYERRAYSRAVETAKYIIDNPASVSTAAAFLEKHVRCDPHQRLIYETWRELIMQPPAAIALALVEDSERGAELRASAPIFVVRSAERPLELLR